MTRKVAVSKQGRICGWQAGKGSWAKLIGGTIRVRAILYFLTFCGSLFAPSLLSVSITDQVHSCVQAGSRSRSEWSQRTICLYNIPNPTTLPFSSSHWDNALDVAGQQSSGLFLSWKYCSWYCMCWAGRADLHYMQCFGILLAYNHVQVLYATCFHIHSWVGSHIVLNVLILDERLVSVILYEPNSRVICLHINHSTPLAYSGKTASLFNWMTWNNHTHWWG